ncbi:MAG: hypothetical protein KYX65_13490, partial [Tabrizicola sp.]|nr:hypothetical protein [Tabrizicola sp.]
MSELRVRITGFTAVAPERAAEKWAAVFRVSHATTTKRDQADISIRHRPDLDFTPLAARFGAHRPVIRGKAWSGGNRDDL